MGTHKFDLSPLPKIRELEQVLPWKKSWIWEASRDGRFPKPIRLGRRTTVWRREDVLAWLDERLRK
jgi:predicted DNA-binding transcriptional regulator AlpA